MVKNIFIIIFIVFGLNTEFLSQGNLLIYPKRVVFKESDNTQKINLVNSGEEPATYTVKFVQRRMNENGSFTEVNTPGPGQNFADAHLRVYPRTVTLNGGEGQTVLLQRKRNSKMKPGEYRSHLSFISVPKPAPLDNTKKDSLNNNFSTKITTIFGISIPVILRYGAINVSVSINNTKLEPDNILSFSINREGNTSIYGDFLIQYIPEEGKPFTVSEVKGIAVYTTIEKRNIRLKLNKLKNVNLTKGSIRIIFKAPSGTKQEVFTEATLLLNS